MPYLAFFSTNRFGSFLRYIEFYQGFIPACRSTAVVQFIFIRFIIHAARFRGEAVKRHAIPHRVAFYLNRDWKFYSRCTHSLRFNLLEWLSEKWKRETADESFFLFFFSTIRAWLQPPRLAASSQSLLFNQHRPEVMTFSRQRFLSFVFEISPRPAEIRWKTVFFTVQRRSMHENQANNQLNFLWSVLACCCSPRALLVSQHRTSFQPPRNIRYQYRQIWK